jgi:outer membrane protein OmpA-like peptidoglycan-associated protein
MLNIGIDFGFLNNRINGTLEVYHKKTKDLIWSYPVPTTQYIYGWMDANVGEMTNKGIELTLNIDAIRTRNFNWMTSINVSHNKNIVDKMQNDQFHTTNLSQGDPMVSGVSADGWTQRIMEGEAIGTFYTYQYAGTVNGRSEYYVLDENGNRTGETTNNPSLKDRSITGHALPKLNAGWNNTLTYKNWSLNAFITGVFGNDVYNAPRAHYTSAQMFSDGKNVLKEFLSFPAGDASGSLPSDRWIENGTYIRLQSLSLSYTFRNCFNDWIQDLTLYGMANNLVTISGYDGLDPEVNLGGIDPGIDYRWSRYPHTRSFMVGVKINFGGSAERRPAAPQTVYVTDNSEIDRLNGELNRLRQELNACNARQPETRIVTQTQAVTFPYLVNFTIGNTDVVNREKVNLEAVATMMKQTPNVRYNVMGYADQQTGSADRNAQLARERSQNVYDILVNQYGVPASQLVRDSRGGVDVMYLNDPQLSRSVIISEVR